MQIEEAIEEMITNEEQGEDKGLTGFSKVSSLTTYENTLLNSYEKIIKILDLNGESVNAEDPEDDEQIPQFTVEELNQEVMSNAMRMKKAGDLLKQAYHNIKKCRDGISQWIRDEVPSIEGRDMIKGDNFVLDLIEK